MQVTMPPFPTPPTTAGRGTEFTTRTPVAWTSGVVLRDRTGASPVVLGGSPWSVTVLPAPVREFARRLYATGRRGITATTPEEQQAAVWLLDRGIVDPLPPALQDAPAVTDVTVVIPVHRDATVLEQALTSLDGQGIPVIVVDDASPQPDAARIAATADAHGAQLVVRETNGGPGEARTDGFHACDTPFVAFMDADVLASDGWVARLRPLFDDPSVGAVGPRVRPDIDGMDPAERDSAVACYEDCRSELDMGPDPSRVVYGVPVGWLPSASVIIRRSAVTDPPFEPGLRVGEDVDLFWRMHEVGWTVRYVTDVVNHHGVRTNWGAFCQRRAMYGGSAADLESRHPTHLIPAQPSASGLTVLAALSTGHPLVAAAVAGYELARKRKELPDAVGWPVVLEMTGKSLWSDCFWMGHLLRRDWWPVGWTVLLAGVPRSKLARGVAVAMLWEPVSDHILDAAHRKRLNPLKALPMRLLDDASYGTGVIRNAVRKRVPNVVTPRLHLPRWPRG